MLRLPSSSSLIAMNQPAARIQARCRLQMRQKSQRNRVAAALTLCVALLAAYGVPAQADPVITYSPVVKKAAPAVVNIFAKRVVRQRVSVSPFMNDPFFRQFFGDGPAVDGPVREKVERSLGSGVIIRADGLI